MTPFAKTHGNQTEESALIEQSKKDPAAFGVLYDRYVDRIYGYALRETGSGAAAQDVTAATFERALLHIRRFRATEKGIAPWLYRIARNEIVQQYRREKRLAPLEHSPAENLDQTERPIESTIAAGERQRSLYAALAQLSKADRDVLTLRYLEQLPTEDVANILECSRDNVYMRLHRALQRLRDLITPEEV